MKKVLSAILVCIMLIGLFVPASAAEAKEETQPALQVVNNRFDIPTHEKSIPVVSAENQSRSATGEFNTLSISSRAKWAEETADILEEAYAQEVVAISEDADYIIFEYNYDDTKLEEGQLLLTKYLKPESNLAGKSSINTKLNYAWGWAQGYSYKNDQKSAMYNATGGLFLTLFSDAVMTLPLSTVISSAISALNFTADYSKAITVTDWVKFYYCNKIGYVQDPNYGYWLPYAYVGERRGFNKVDSIIYDYAGQPHTKGYMEEDGIPANNPTNSRKVQKKSNYDNDAWIINKALTQYQNDDGVYSNIFETVGHFCETMP